MQICVKRLVDLKRNFWSYCAVLLFARALENGLSKDSKLVMLCVLNNTFFGGVMVMADDTDLKANHLHLLAQLRNLFTAVADVSVLQG